MSRVLYSMDIDLEKFADSIRDLADAIEDNEALVNRVTTAETVSAEDGPNPTMHTLMIRYILSASADEARPIIEYDLGDEDVKPVEGSDG